jgi:phage baseplate assembly protein W
MTRVGDLLGRGMAFPPHVGADGRIAWSEGETNIREGILLSTLTEPGERPRLPEFGGGLRGLLFQPNTTPTHHEVGVQIRAAIADWEPRVRVLGVDVQADPENPESAVATATYELVSTGDVRALTLTIALGG